MTTTEGDRMAGTAVARRRSATPGVAAGSALDAYTDEQVSLLKTQLISPDKDGNQPSDLELAYFGQVAQRLGLDPFRKQITAQLRQDKRAPGGRKLVIITTIDGYRTVAHRTGDFAGEDTPQWCGQDGHWIDVWLKDEPPAAARQTVYRKGSDRGFTAVVTYREFCQTDYSGNPVSQWKTMPAHMLAKCAEAGALRRAFQEAFDGVYADAELGSPDVIDAQAFVDSPTAARVEATVDASAFTGTTTTTTAAAPSSQRQAAAPTPPPVPRSAPAEQPAASDSAPAAPPPAAAQEATPAAITSQQIKDEIDSFSAAEKATLRAWCVTAGGAPGTKFLGAQLAATGKTSVAALINLPDPKDSGTPPAETSQRDAGETGAPPPEPHDPAPVAEPQEQAEPAEAQPAEPAASRTPDPKPEPTDADRVAAAWAAYCKNGPEQAADFAKRLKDGKFVPDGPVTAADMLAAFGTRAATVEGMAEIHQTIKALPAPDAVIANGHVIDNARISQALSVLDEDEQERLASVCQHAGIRIVMPSKLAERWGERAYDLRALITTLEQAADFQAWIEQQADANDPGVSASQETLV